MKIALFSDVTNKDAVQVIFVRFTDNVEKAAKAADFSVLTNE